VIAILALLLTVHGTVAAPAAHVEESYAASPQDGREPGCADDLPIHPAQCGTVSAALTTTPFVAAFRRDMAPAYGPDRSRGPAARRFRSKLFRPPRFA
jgi:hypothetical protein